MAGKKGKTAYKNCLKAIALNVQSLLLFKYNVKTRTQMSDLTRSNAGKGLEKQALSETVYGCVNRC